MNNEKKREIAYRLLQGESMEHHPAHQSPRDHKGPNGRINDSHLCHFSVSEREFVIVSVKYVDRGKSPCIGFYWDRCNQKLGPIPKRTHLKSIKKLPLPEGFFLDEGSITNKASGWVPFCRTGCVTADEMYRQIVDPGEGIKPWQDLFNTLVNWGKEEFGCDPIYYSQEDWL